MVYFLGLKLIRIDRIKIIVEILCFEKNTKNIIFVRWDRDGGGVPVLRFLCKWLFLSGH